MHLFLFARVGWRRWGGAWWLVAVAGPAAGQPVPKPPAPRVQELAFFLGNWAGKGAFASGKPIEADASFGADLDGQVVLYRHTDRPPQGFKALSVWRFDPAANRFVALLHDNFGGAREFVATGWQANQLVFEAAPAAGAGASAASPAERFVYQKLSSGSFKMTYERDRRDGRGWQLGDYLVFRKQP